MNENKLYGYCYYAGIMETELSYFFLRILKILKDRNNYEFLEEKAVEERAVEFHVISEKEKEIIIFFKKFIKSIKNIIQDEENLKKWITKEKNKIIQYSFAYIKEMLDKFKDMVHRIREI